MPVSSGRHLVGYTAVYFSAIVYGVHYSGKGIAGHQLAHSLFVEYILGKQFGAFAIFGYRYRFTVLCGGKSGES